MSLLGNRVARVEDPRMLTVGGTYVDDIRLERAAHAVFVRSPIAHAVISSIDTSDAELVGGVLSVVTADDLDAAPLPVIMPVFPEPALQPLLASRRVRHVGEPVAAVVAESVEAALDAAELVHVEYDPLRPVVTLDQSEEGDVLLYPGLDSNIVNAHPGSDESFDTSGCDIVVEHTFVNQRVAAVPIEPRVAAAAWDGDRLTQWASTQGGGRFRAALVETFGYEPAQVRVITPDVGGGFGAKAGPHAEELLVAELARRVDRPVRWSETRSENLVAMVHGRAAEQQVVMAGSSTGDITHWRVHIRQDAGAYPSIGAILPFAGRLMLTGVYDIPNVQFSSCSLATNTTPVGAYRGAGRPEAAAALERAIDLFAANAGLEPAEVRRRNLLPPFDGPHTTPTGTIYDAGDYPGALERLLEAVDYDSVRAEQARRRNAGGTIQIGIGLATYVEVTAIGGPEGSSEFGTVELQADGAVVARTGSTPYGQGHVTTWSMLVADRLGVDMEQVTVVHGDTAEIASESVTGGSRSVQIAGSSMADAAEKLVELARDRAAGLLEASADDIVLDLDQGRFHVTGTPAISVGWTDIAARDAAAPLTGVSDFVQEQPSFPFGAHCAVVEVDTETGEVRFLRHVAVDDCGTIINPLIAEGQVHGGIAQGAAQALLEEVRFDENGNLLTGNLANYAAISAPDLPSFERIEMVTPTPLNPLGAKGIGESGTIGSTPAVHNAVIDALSPFGVRHLDMPCTPERVWRALRPT